MTIMKKRNPAWRKWARPAAQILGLGLAVAGVLSGTSIPMTILIAVTFLMGPVFCGWVCPYGFLQDLASRLGRKLGIRKREPGPGIRRVLDWSRYVLLAVVLLFSFDLIFTLLSMDPRANWMLVLTGRVLPIAGWAVLVLMLVAALFYERPFCRHLCIEGAKQGLYSLLRPFTVVRNPETCIGCGKCDRACPMSLSISNKEQVRSPQCISCLECTAACPVEGALRVGLPTFHGRFGKVALPVMLTVGVLLFGYVAANGNDLILPQNWTLSSTQTVYAAEAGGTSTSTVAGPLGDAAGVADGTYEGSGSGYRGTTTVEVTVQNERIVSIEVLDTDDDARWFNRAYNTIVSTILSEQTSDVDEVSGATFSSVAIQKAVADALTNAGGTQVADVADVPATTTRGHGKRGGFH